MSGKQNNTKAHKNLFGRYLHGNITEHERTAVDSWYDSLEQQSTDELPQMPQSYATGVIRAGILHVVSKHTKQSKTKWFRLPLVKYAASLSLLAGLTLWYFQYNTNPAAKDQSPQFFTTNATSTKRIVLTDGSTVLLNKSGSLRISADFNKKQRKVVLIGEAFFTIAKDKSKPFIIQSANLKTTVLGTSFNVSAYPDISEIKIAVASGNVKVSRTRYRSGDVPLASSMTRNQILVFDTNTQLAEVKTGDTELIRSWTNQQLYLDNISIDGIAKQLSRHFSIKVSLDPAIKDASKYTIMLGKESLKGSMDILTALTRHEFYIKQNQLFIMNKK